MRLRVNNPLLQSQRGGEGDALTFGATGNWISNTIQGGGQDRACFGELGHPYVG